MTVQTSTTINGKEEKECEGHKEREKKGTEEASEAGPDRSDRFWIKQERETD